MVKKKLTLVINEETINNSKKLKFNISAMVEEMLKKAIVDKPKIINKRYLREIQIYSETVLVNGKIIREAISKNEEYIPNIKE